MRIISLSKDRFICLPFITCTMGHSADALILRESRKQFIGYYFFSFLLTGWAAYLSLRGYTLHSSSFFIVCFIAIGGVAAPELFRKWSYSVVTPRKIEVLSGILHRRHRNFYPNMITEIHVRQRMFQRLLNYGKITLNSTYKQEFCLGMVNSPHTSMEKIEAILQR